MPGCDRRNRRTGARVPSQSDQHGRRAIPSPRWKLAPNSQVRRRVTTILGFVSQQRSRANRTDQRTSQRSRRCSSSTGATGALIGVWTGRAKLGSVVQIRTRPVLSPDNGQRTTDNTGNARIFLRRDCSGRDVRWTLGSSPGSDHIGGVGSRRKRAHLGAKGRVLRGSSWPIFYARNDFGRWARKNAPT
jgi:hypothetical protein